MAEKSKKILEHEHKTPLKIRKIELAFSLKSANNVCLQTHDLHSLPPPSWDHRVGFEYWNASPEEEECVVAGPMLHHHHRRHMVDSVRLATKNYGIAEVLVWEPASKLCPALTEGGPSNTTPPPSPPPPASHIFLAIMQKFAHFCTFIAIFINWQRNPSYIQFFSI